jgi:hypothetical protein
MAADTAQKRYSLIGLGSPVPRLLPIPQGSFAADDRALLIYLYSGLDAEAAVEAEIPSGGWVRRRHRHPEFRGETETERQARTHAERIRMGIIPPDYIHTDITTTGDINSDTAGDTTAASPVPPAKASAGSTEATEGPQSVASLLRIADYRGLEELATKAATRTLDDVIAARIGALALEEEMAAAAAARDDEIARVAALDEEMARARAAAARDEEIALLLRLDEERRIEEQRLYQQWLRDEDDAAVLLLAIATIH